MPYAAEISRVNPGCILFLIDQSASMEGVMEPDKIQALDGRVTADNRTYTDSASGKTKAQGVADTVNRLLQNLIIKCAGGEGIRDFFHVGVIGYGGDLTSTRVGPAFGGLLAGREIVSVTEVADAPARIEKRTNKVPDGKGRQIDQTVKSPIWFDAFAVGRTPMCGALTRTMDILQDWIAQHPASYPPIVINITDGDANDGDPVGPAEALRALSTDDGNVLLFNVHLSSRADTRRIEFPDSDVALPDKFATRLFAMSSVLPSRMQAVAREEGMTVTQLSRGFAFKADLVSLFRFLDIGTRVSLH